MIAPTFVFRSLQNPIYSVTLDEEASTSQGTLYAGDSEGVITAFSLDTRREVRQWKSFHQNSVMSLWKNEGMMCSQGRDGLVKAWDIEEDRLLFELFTGTSNFCKAAFATKSSILSTPVVACTTASARDVKLWDLNSASVIATLDQFEEKLGMCMSVQILSAASFGSHVCIGYENGGVYFWDLKMNKVLFQLDAKLEESVISTAFNYKSTEGVCGGAGSEILKFKVCWSDQVAKECRVAKLPQNGINELRVRRDNKIVVGAGWDHRIRVWQWKDMKPLGVLKYHSEGVSSITFSKHDNLLVSAGQDAKIALWNIY